MANSRASDPSQLSVAALSVAALSVAERSVAKLSVAKLSVAELRKRYLDEARPLPAVIERQMRADPRRGVQNLLDAIARRRQLNRAEGRRLRRLRRYEDQLVGQGLSVIAGVDEAGMSPLAGPVVAAAAILPLDFKLSGIDDSKKLSAETRQRMAPYIRSHALAWGVGFVTPAEIDRINIYQAGLLAMRRAVEALATQPQHLLVDARRIPDLDVPQTPIVHGDAESMSIAAASILAKTTRDAHMVELDAQFPGYGFARHKGYPVRAHYEALQRLGPCPVHRRSFAPVRAALGKTPAQQTLFES